MMSIHVDVDNLWVYEKEYGIRLHTDPEYIYSHSLPHFLRLLDKYKSKATFLIIGKDLLLPACQKFVRTAHAKGHEIGNHTWSHSVHFAQLSHIQKKYEIQRTHHEIAKYTACTPVGFRGPGYFVDQDVVNILGELEYLYDASVLPGPAGLGMRLYAHIAGGKNKEKSFGRLRDILGSSYPHIMSSESGEKVIELPLSVFPFLRTPIHSTFAYMFGSMYKSMIYAYIRSKPLYLTYVFHAIDFVDVPVDTKSVVLPLRHAYESRMKFIEEILRLMVQSNGRPLRTTRDSLVTATRR